MLIPAFCGIVLTAQAQTTQELSSRLDDLENALKSVQKKLSENYIGRPKLNKIDNVDALIMHLQEIQMHIETVTNDVETLRFEISALKKETEKINADTTMRFKELEGKLAKTDERAAAAEAVILKAQEEKLAQERALAKEKEKEAARIQAEKNRQNKLKKDYGAKKPKTLYNEALEALNKKEYVKAQKMFAAFLELHPQNELAGNAQYWQGESYYAQGKFETAAVSFADGYKNYKNSAKAPDLLFKLGMTLARLKKKSEACVAFDSFSKQYPKVSEAMKKQLETETKKLSCK